MFDRHGFTHRYNSVSRFVADLKARESERFDALEFLAGEDAQVDYGQGTRMHTPKSRSKPSYLFVMPLKYSGKSSWKVAWQTDQQIWAPLYETAWRTFGACSQHVALDNLKEGLFRSDIYASELNPAYSALLTHYDGVVADPCHPVLNSCDLNVS